MLWHIGCSGFHYKEWKDVFYPPGLPQRKWFEYYSSQFNTIELNVTFYRFPRIATLQKWYEQSSEHFNFVVKAPRSITHFRQFINCENMLNDFYGTVVAGLKDKLGAVLFQMPPTFDYTRERLDRILQNANTDLRNVIEFRHASWWATKVLRELKKKKIIFSGISYPSLPAGAIVNGSCAYYRFHGIPKLYYSTYKTNVLKTVADSYLHQKNKLKEVFIYFNNTATAGAISNAIWLKNYLAKKQAG